MTLSWAPGNRWGHGSEVRQILGRGGRGTRVPRLEPHPGSVQRDQAQWTASAGGVSARGSCSQYSRWSLAGAHIASILTATPLPSPLESCPSDPVLFALQPSVGQVARVDVSSKVEVVWADNSKTIILPQVRLLGAHGSAPDSGSQAEGSGLPGEGIFSWEAGSWGKEGQC